MPGWAAVDWVRRVFLIIVSYAVQNKMADIDESCTRLQFRPKNTPFNPAMLYHFLFNVPDRDAIIYDLHFTRRYRQCRQHSCLQTIVG